MTPAARRLTVLLVMLAALSISTAAAWAAVPPGGDGPPSEAESTGEAAPPGEQDCRGVRNLLPRCAAAAARDRVGEAVGAGLSMATAGMFEQLYDWVVGGTTWLLRKLVSLMDSSTRPSLGGGWFGRSYGLMAGLAMLLVLPLLMVATITSVLRQDWSALARCYLVFLPAAGIGTGVAIPLTDIGLDVTDWMSSLFLDTMRDDIQAFLDTVARALDTAGVASQELPLFLAFIAAVIIALGAFAVWVELVLRTAGIYVATFFLPLGFAALVWPATRSWFARLVKTVVALILSKFVIVAVFALAAAALGNLGGAGFAGVISGAALMLMAAFSPLVLFRLADVAGSDVAASFTGATQGRTSPVPVPDARRSAASVYGRIMRDRTAGAAGAQPALATASGSEGVASTSGAASVQPALATASGSAGVGSGGGAGLVGAAAVGSSTGMAAATPGRVGRQASERAGQQVQPGGPTQSPSRHGLEAATAAGSDNGRGGSAGQPPRRQGDTASPASPVAAGSAAQPQPRGDATAAQPQPVQPAAEAPIAQPARPLPSGPPPSREKDR